MASVTIPKFFKEYEGTIADFITGYNAATAAKKAELDSGQVFIHDTNDTGLAIWAHGKMYVLGDTYTKIVGTNSAAQSVSGNVTWNITHQLGTSDVICIIKDASTGEEVDCNIIYNPTPSNSTYTITVSMNLASDLPAGSYKYIIIGGTTAGGGGGGGTGSVTQVDTGAGLSGGPITTTGVISLATAYGDAVNPYGSKTAKTFLAAPNAAAGVPSFRTIVASDLPDLSGTYASKTHAHGNISSTGTLTDTAATAATNDKLVIRDANDNKIQTSNILGTDVADAVSKKHEHSTLTLSKTAQTYDGTHTLALPSSDPYTTARTPTSHTHGNISNTGTLTDTAAAAATGDKLVIRDASNSKIQTSSLAFDSSDPNRYLAKDGSWHTAVIHHASANPALTPTNGVATWTVTHNLNTRHRITQVIASTSTTTTWMSEVGLEPGQVLNCRIVNTNVNTTTIYINTTTTIQADSVEVEIFAL